jgi:hypothetical protein
MTGQDVFRKLMDVDLLLQDGSKMVALRMFLDSIRGDNPALAKLAAEIDAFEARLRILVAASEKVVLKR